MYSSQLTDYRRLQNTICDILKQQQQGNSNYYTNNNDIIPDSDNQYTIGDSNHRFHSVYLGPGTIYMGDASQTSVGVNYCNVLWCKPGVATSYIEFANSNYPEDTESIQSGIHVFYNVACNDLWKRYPDGTTASFGTVRGETGPQGPIWQFSNDLLPLTPGLNIGAAASNINNLYLSNTLVINGAAITSLSGYLNYQGQQVATSTDLTNGLSTLSSIVSYGLSSVAEQPNPGLSTLSSIVSYGLSSVLGAGNAIGISSLSSVVSYGLSSILNSNTQQPYLGGMLRVDQIYGNDTNAPANKYQTAFKTIGAAMARANYGDQVWVLPGTYNEAVVFSNGVNLRGVNLNSVIIQQLNVTNNTTLITLASNSRLEDVTLKLTSSSSNAKQLVGVLFSNVQGTAKIRTVVTNFDNSAMTCNVATNFYGIYSTGNSATGVSSFDEMQRCTINVTSSGPGAKRGIYLDGSNALHCRDVNIYCKDNPTYSVSSNGTYFGCETNHPNAVFTIKTATTYGFAAVSGNVSADISQTQGQIILASTDLPNRNGNGKGFTADIAQPSLTFGISGAPDKYLFTYLIPGVVNGGNADIPTYYGIRCPTLSMIDQLSFQVQSIVTAGMSVAALLYKNSNIQSNFTLILSNGGPTFITTSNLSLTITKNDTYAIILSNVGTNNFHTTGAGTDYIVNYPLITVSFY